MKPERCLSYIKNSDLRIFKAISNEVERQENTIELIPSENIVSPAVMQAQGSVLTNKYSEGYPSKRYYGGNKFIDVCESLAVERAKKLFRAEHSNVQPLSGSIMNVAVYFGLLNPKDVILGMDLGHGGHLTHGHPITHMAKIFKFVGYKTEKTGEIDYKKLEELAKKVKPKLLLAGFSAYSRNLNWKEFKRIADLVGAYTLADVSHIGGLIAGGVLENPLDFDFDVMTTTTHKTLRGPRGGLILCKKEFAKQIDKSIFPQLQGGPLEHIIAGKAICFKEASSLNFKKYSRQTLKNAKALERGLVENGIKICFGKTENHLLLIDLRENKVCGKEIEEILDEVGICVNKNALPDDTASPLNPNGIRIGTPLITTRGFKEIDCERIGRAISDIIKNSKNLEVRKKVRKFTLALCRKYPISGFYEGGGLN